MEIKTEIKTYRCDGCKVEYRYTGETMTYCPGCTPSAEYERDQRVIYGETRRGER